MQEYAGLYLGSGACIDDSVLIHSRMSGSVTAASVSVICSAGWATGVVRHVQLRERFVQL